MQPTQLITDLIKTVAGPSTTQEVMRRPRPTRRHPFDDAMHTLNRVAIRVTPFCAGTLLGFIGAVWLDHTASR